MHNPQYALVAYVHHPVSQFIESLRRKLHPDLPHLPAHLTILPPRPLLGPQGATAESKESLAIESLAEMCCNVEPFEIGLGDVQSFVPVTPTVFIRVEHAAYRMQDLHDCLNVGLFSCEERWPYMPHLTIVKMGTKQQALDAFELAQERWKQYVGSRHILLEGLTFVREGANNTWLDLADVPLGRSLVSGKRP